VLIARELGLNDEECETLRKTALLHDIGKIGITDSVLNKPGKLTDEEYELMKSHVTKGAEILKDFTLIDKVWEGALYHHERYDGKGYVHGLKAEEIPINARIIGIADAFDAMTANRVYRKKQSFDYVLSELKKGRGTQFDPQLVDIMLKLIEEGKIDINALYNDGEM
jgi:energy-coupling factor transport system substrate-specific component